MVHKLKHPLTAFLEKEYKSISYFNVIHVGFCPEWDYERKILVKFGELPVCQVMSAIKPKEYFEFLLSLIEEKKNIHKSMGIPIEDKMSQRFEVTSTENTLYALSATIPTAHTYGYVYPTEGIERPYAMFQGRYEVRLLTEDQYEQYKNGLDIE